MPRKGHVQKREILPDLMYNSKLVTNLIDHLMVDDKRGTATEILYAAFDETKNETDNGPVEVFQQTMENVMPVLEIKARRVGGSNYQVPIEVRPGRRTTLSLRWTVQYARLCGEHTVVERLVREIIDASNNAGASVKKCEDTYRMTEANRASAHHRWQ